MWIWILGAALACAVLAFVVFEVAARLEHARGAKPPVIPAVDRDAPCPSCGHRDGELRFDAALKLVVHTCRVCKAAWGEKTVVNPSGWVGQ